MVQKERQIQIDENLETRRKRKDKSHWLGTGEMKDEKGVGGSTASRKKKTGQHTLAAAKKNKKRTGEV